MAFISTTGGFTPARLEGIPTIAVIKTESHKATDSFSSWNRGTRLLMAFAHHTIHSNSTECGPFVILYVMRSCSLTQPQGTESGKWN